VNHNSNNIKGLIFIISGPSGSGKTTLLESLLKNKALKRILVKSVSLTTRPRRSTERNSRDYFFITEKEFKRLRKAKKILEWTRYLGYYYATPKDFVEEQLEKRRHLIVSLDLKGALRMKRLCPKNTVTIFILPPSLETLRKRIEGRCHKTEKAEIGQRLKLAQEELLGSYKYDYCLMNKNLPQAVKELQGIILREIGISLER
jgi:guanylate kinase